MKTYLPVEKEVKRDWFLVDADGRILGRLAVQISDILRGKHKPIYTPHVDTGDFVIVINAEKIKVSGKKEEQKTYARYSGFRSGLKEFTTAKVRELHPDRLISLAVKGMLPKNNLSRTMISRLKVYAGDKHPHAAQNPQKNDKLTGKGVRRG